MVAAGHFRMARFAKVAAEFRRVDTVMISHGLGKRWREGGLSSQRQRKGVIKGTVRLCVHIHLHVHMLAYGQGFLFQGLNGRRRLRTLGIAAANLRSAHAVHLHSQAR